jgi:site-specific DNA-methyltransferase (adenine-specific)
MNILTENYKLFNGDCLEVMDRLIKMGIKVDMILCDPPYGTTACKWDSIIPFDEMWERLNKLIKPNGVIALFGSQPFTSKLVCSNIKNFKYDWYWIKEKGKGHLLAKKQPLKNVEIISIFYKKQCLYNPQFSEGKPYQRLNCNNQKTNKGIYNNASNETFDTVNTSGKRYPKNALNFTSVQRTVHPTQKPVDLLEYLIKTYTNEDEIVLDFTMGSGSTGVACVNTNRRFIGIELDEKYFNISINRIFENYNK